MILMWFVVFLEQEAWCFSLHNKQLSQKFIDKQKEVDQKKEAWQGKKIEVNTGNDFRTKQFSKKKNKLGRLKELE